MKKSNFVELNSNELEEVAGGSLLAAIAISYIAGYAIGCTIVYYANK